ncbi:MAG TPA: hypothetical protein VER79_07095 [Candidatus Limnocylindrales bacterium]|nr:hypothetical protein [Candidatus Limnocylindrales bacterium]
MSKSAGAPQSSARYNRRRRGIAPIVLILGLIVGVAAGLIIAWVIAPVQQIDISPSQLNEADQTRYLEAIALAYAQDGNLDQAVRRLVELRLSGDPIQVMADTACTLATSGYVNSTSGLRSVQAMVSFYQLQGRVGCADDVIKVQALDSTQVVELTLPTATLTLAPPATKTATPEGNLLETATSVAPLIQATPLPAQFELANVATSCSAGRPGVIEVLVYEANGSTGIPGQQVRVRWNGQDNLFVTGLQPDRGPGFADFVMEEGQSYLVDLPGQSPVVQPALAASPCTDPTTGERSIITYRVSFRAQG